MGEYVTKPVASFREMPDRAWRFFTKTKEVKDAFGDTVEHFQIKPCVKNLVQFESFNLKSDSPLVRGPAVSHS